MVEYGRDIVRFALKDIGVLDPTEPGHPEILNDGIAVASTMLDSWRNDNLTIDGITRSVFNLATNTQSYTIGDAATFNTNFPNKIHLWSVIPNDAAATPLELTMGRPVTYDVWQGIRMKSQTGAYPTTLWFDDKYVAGNGRCLFHPIPNNANVDVVLYADVPSITTLVLATQYDLRPGMSLAIKKNLAWTLVNGRFKRQGDWSALREEAANALAAVRRVAIKPKESRVRSEFVIGSGAGRRTFNIRTGGN